MANRGDTPITSSEDDNDNSNVFTDIGDIKWDSLPIDDIILIIGGVLNKVRPDRDADILCDVKKLKALYLDLMHYLRLIKNRRDVMMSELMAAGKMISKLNFGKICVNNNALERYGNYTLIAIGFMDRRPRALGVAANNENKEEKKDDSEGDSDLDYSAEDDDEDDETDESLSEVSQIDGQVTSQPSSQAAPAPAPAPAPQPEVSGHVLMRDSTATNNDEDGDVTVTDNLYIDLTYSTDEDANSQNDGDLSPRRIPVWVLPPDYKRSELSEQETDSDAGEPLIPDNTNPLDALSCGVCLRHIRYTSQRVEFNHGGDNRHVFHKRCILQWMKIAVTCPICKKIVDTYALERAGIALWPLLLAREESAEKLLITISNMHAYNGQSTPRATELYRRTAKLRDQIKKIIRRPSHTVWPKELTTIFFTYGILAEQQHAKFWVEGSGPYPTNKHGQTATDICPPEEIKPTYSLPMPKSVLLRNSPLRGRIALQRRLKQLREQRDRLLCISWNVIKELENPYYTNPRFVAVVQEIIGNIRDDAVRFNAAMGYTFISPNHIEKYYDKDKVVKFIKYLAYKMKDSRLQALAKKLKHEAQQPSPKSDNRMAVDDNEEKDDLKQASESPTASGASTTNKSNKNTYQSANRQLRIWARGRDSLLEQFDAAEQEAIFESCANAFDDPYRNHNRHYRHNNNNNNNNNNNSNNNNNNNSNNNNNNDNNENSSNAPSPSRTRRILAAASGAISNASGTLSTAIAQRVPIPPTISRHLAAPKPSSNNNNNDDNQNNNDGGNNRNDNERVFTPPPGPQLTPPDSKRIRKTEQLRRRRIGEWRQNIRNMVQTYHYKMNNMRQFIGFPWKLKNCRHGVYDRNSVKISDSQHECIEWWMGYRIWQHLEINHGHKRVVGLECVLWPSSYWKNLNPNWKDMMRNKRRLHLESLDLDEPVDTPIAAEIRINETKYIRRHNKESKIYVLWTIGKDRYGQDLAPGYEPPPTTIINSQPPSQPNHSPRRGRGRGRGRRRGRGYGRARHFYSNKPYPQPQPQQYPEMNMNNQQPRPSTYQSPIGNRRDVNINNNDNQQRRRDNNNDRGNQPQPMDQDNHQQ